MPEPIVLDVTRCEQLPGLCGAATAQMILHFKGLTSSTVEIQRALWEQIQANTAGQRPRGKIHEHDCPAFDNQKCERCRDDRLHTCWCTHPRALEATINDYLNPGVTFTLHRDGRTATAQALASVDAKVPAAVLVYGWVHWLTVIGYTPGEGAGDDSTIIIGGRPITEVYVCDPSTSAGKDHAMAVRTWLNFYLTFPVQCGEFVNQYPVIASR